MQELQNESELVTSNQNEDTVSDINETDEEIEVAAPEIPTEELEEYVELEQPPTHEPPRYNLRQRRPWLQNADDYVTPQQKRLNLRRAYNMTLRQAMETRGVLPAKDATKQKLQLVDKGCFRPIGKSEINLLHKLKRRILPSKLCLKDKHKPDVTFEKLKARLVAGGHRQDHTEYDMVSSLTCSQQQCLL